MVDIYDAVPEPLMTKIRVMSECDDVRDLPGFPLYAVTRTGQVWSVKGIGTQLIANLPRRLKPHWRKGYSKVQLHRNTEQVSLSIPRCIAMAFLPPPDNDDMQAIVKDGDYQNMCPENIEWSTPSQRVIQSLTRHGGAFVFGEKQGGNVLTEAQIREAYDLYESGWSMIQLAQHFNCGKRAIRRAIKGQSWRHLGLPAPKRRSHPYGEQSPLARFTDEQIVIIRQEYEQVRNMTAIARKYDCSVSTIECIVKRRTWRHVN